MDSNKLKLPKVGSNAIVLILVGAGPNKTLLTRLHTCNSSQSKEGDVLWPIYKCEEDNIWQSKWNKNRCYWERVENIARTWGTNWEIDENTLGTKENNKKPTPPTATQKKKKSRHLEHMQIFSLAA
jgi:hypothetical protein